MPEETLTGVNWSVVVASSNRLGEVLIEDGNIIYIADKQRIAMDWGGKRTFYNQVEILETEDERRSLENPVEDNFYFIVGSAILWTYHKNQWIPVTSSPTGVIYIGDDLPEVGRDQTLYTNKKEREISVWDSEKKEYILVANASFEIPESQINALFK